MTPDLDAIEARIAAAPGPWLLADPTTGEIYAGDVHDWDSPNWKYVGTVNDEADAELIAHAPEDLAALAAEVRTLRADVFTLRADARMADDISRDRARERAEITRLRSIADAARAFLAAWERGEDETHAIDEADDLRDALDALLRGAK